MWNGAEKEVCGDAVESNNKKDAENRPASDQQRFASNDTANVPVSEGIQARSVFPQIASFASCPGMADDTMTIPGDTDDTTILIPPPNVAEFQIECKTEPGTELGNSIDDDPLVFDESSLLHIPIFAPAIKDPVILLERCDKIWETLQLIKTVQVEKPTTLTDDDCDKNEEEKNEEKVQHLDEIEQSESHVKNQPRLRSDNTMPPFKVSVLRTKKLHPCTTCGIQYLERRSLRKHSERVHGVVLPLLVQRKRLKLNALNKKNFNGTSQVSSISKEINNSEKLYDNKDSCDKTTAKTKLTNVETTASPSTVSTRFVKCTLCQQKVLCLRKHLINYHKIGGSASVMEQLESSLLNEPKISPGDKQTTLKNEPHQDGFRIMDNENDTRRTSKVQGKRKYKLSYPRKKRKLNNERYTIVQNPPTVTQEEILSAYKCDICLGLYKTTHSLYKHKRNHILRGETKENFHEFTCRYFNSPFNKKYKLLQSSMKSTNTIANSANNRINKKHTSQLNNSKRNTLRNQNSSISNRAIRYSERINNKNNETTCICGRSFRNPHTLFLHKNNCELCQNEDTVKSSRVSSDRDSGIGINITIKKRNDSYEIVGKDDEDKPENSKTRLKEDTSSMSHTSNYTKDFTKASTKQQVLDTSDSSKYSKDHSILKLEDTDEDVIIDIEDDVQIALDENNTIKQMVTRENGKQNSSKQQNDTKDGKNENIFNEVNTLKQMCQKVLDIRKSGNIEDKNETCNQIKKTSKKNNQIKDQETHQNKRELRSANKRYLYSKIESDYSHDESKVCTVQFKPMTCGYCKEQFNNIKSYDNHQCTFTKGRSFDEFSLQLRCFFCKDVLNSYSEFDEHMKFKHFDRGYHCFQCPEQFTNDKARISHFHSDHNDLICRFCNKRITISLKTPHEGYHLGFGYPCHKCKKAYTNSKNLSYHKYTIHFNGADNLVTCTICLKSVKLKTFRGHMKCHKHNACYFCGKVFSDRVGLEYHTMMNHGTNSKLKCNICGTRFYTKKLLEKHEKIDGCNNYMQQRMKS